MKTIIATLAVIAVLASIPADANNTRFEIVGTVPVVCSVTEIALSKVNERAVIVQGGCNTEKYLITFGSNAGQIERVITSARSRITPEGVEILENDFSHNVKIIFKDNPVSNVNIGMRAL